MAIGFVDLGGLAAACELLPARDPEALRMALLGEACTAAGGSFSGSSSSSRILQPLRWVGYEMSAYSVAKTLVILEMMEQGAAVNDTLQVRRATVCACQLTASTSLHHGMILTSFEQAVTPLRLTCQASACIWQLLKEACMLSLCDCAFYSPGCLHACRSGTPQHGAAGLWRLSGAL